MNAKHLLPILTGLLILTGQSFAAETKTIRPGLWEHSFEVSSQSGQLEAAMEEAKKAMAAMPPEQRKMVEQMMQAQGVNLDMRSAKVRACITEEQAKNYVLPQNDGCSQSIEKIGSDRLKIQFNCSGNPPTSGEGEIHIVNEKSYNGNLTVKTAMMGNAETMQAKQTGKWLADDCGDTQPIATQ